MRIRQVSITITITVFVVLCPEYHYAVNGNNQTGAQQAAMAQSVIMLPIPGLSLNQASFGWSDTTFCELYTRIQPGLPGLSLYSAKFNTTLLGGGFGLHFQRFGYEVYSENKTGLGYGKKLGKRLSAGIQLNYVYTYFKGPYKNYHGFVAEAGIQAIFNKWFFGAHIYNPTLSKTYKSKEEIPETILRLGAGVQIIKSFIMTFEAEKQLEIEPNFKMGFHYVFQNGFNIQTGMQSALKQFSAGAGFTLKNLSINVAVTTNPYLEPATHVSLKYSL